MASWEYKLEFWNKSRLRSPPCELFSPMKLCCDNRKNVGADRGSEVTVGANLVMVSGSRLEAAKWVHSKALVGALGRSPRKLLVFKDFVR